MNEIEIKNQGPIEYTKISVPSQGGVVRLLGPNGCGKTNALEGVSQLVNRRGKLVAKDGSSGPEISGFGATVKVGRRLSRSGELEILGLEGLDISTLVDPKIDDPVAADAKRIKALLQLTGAAEAKAEKFYPVVSSQQEFDKYVPSEALATDDIVLMQAAVKRYLEKASRDEASLATRAFAEAEASRLSSKDIDISLPDDSELLFAAQEDATTDLSRLKAEQKAYRDAVRKQEEAQSELNNLKTLYSGPTSDEAIKISNELALHLNDAETLVENLRNQLTAAEAEENRLKSEKAIIDEKLASAEAHERAIESFQKIINASLPANVTEEQITNASERLRITREAVQQGALVRKAKEDNSKASQRRQEAIQAQAKAEELRSAAQATEMVLSSAVESLGVPLKVKNNRLVVVGTERGEEVFDDLSAGQKWKLVIQIAIKAVGKGIVVLPQTAWQDLDQANKDIIAQEVTGSGLVILTAQADSTVPELTSDIYDPYQLKE